MNSAIKVVNKVRIWAFVVCFASGGLLVLAHFGHFGLDRFITGMLWSSIENISRISAIFAVVTTFIVLIDRAGDGLNELQRKKDQKKKNKRH
ncbi:hypothetical protein [Halomonas llamarensis]|uniref:Uncharacterized protein n=1 Tax=Halomonas llamarensis TaxID=2945104 RepID=A0ABT0SS78_9GAMM|nr:hypothetical protein [Halomonas llamarensis]MCL7930418.1 hypothetical protein [Halomonas llamarensis]